MKFHSYVGVNIIALCTISHIFCSYRLHSGVYSRYLNKKELKNPDCNIAGPSPLQMIPLCNIVAAHNYLTTASICSGASSTLIVWSTGDQITWEISDMIQNIEWIYEQSLKHHFHNIYPRPIDLRSSHIHILTFCVQNIHLRLSSRPNDASD